jgi:hypothetical protein
MLLGCLGCGKRPKVSSQATCLDFVEVAIHSYRHRYGAAQGDPGFDHIELDYLTPRGISPIVNTMGQHVQKSGANVPFAADPQSTQSTRFVSFAFSPPLLRNRGFESGFESAHQTGDTVERLLGIVCREGLFPNYLGGYFNNLIGAMKAGVPKIRDRQGGHGAAPGDDPVPDHIAAFALHLTAANIVMLVKAHRAQELK